MKFGIFEIIGIIAVVLFVFIVSFMLANEAIKDATENGMVLSIKVKIEWIMASFIFGLISAFGLYGLVNGIIFILRTTIEISKTHT